MGTTGLAGVFNPTDLSPASSYGVQLAEISNTPLSTVVGANTNDGSGHVNNAVGGGIGDHFALHWDNPIFWFLLLLVLFVGYVGFLFDFSVKRIGSINISGGKRG